MIKLTDLSMLFCTHFEFLKSTNSSLLSKFNFVLFGTVRCLHGAGGFCLPALDVCIVSVIRQQTLYESSGVLLLLSVVLPVIWQAVKSEYRERH